MDGEQQGVENKTDRKPEKERKSTRSRVELEEHEKEEENNESRKEKILGRNKPCYRRE